MVSAQEFGSGEETVLLRLRRFRNELNQGLLCGRGAPYVLNGINCSIEETRMFSHKVSAAEASGVV